MSLRQRWPRPAEKPMAPGREHSGRHATFRKQHVLSEAQQQRYLNRKQRHEAAAEAAAALQEAAEMLEDPETL